MRDVFIISMAELVNVLFVAIALIVFHFTINEGYDIKIFFLGANVTVKFFMIIIWIIIGFFNARFTHSEILLLLNLVVLIAFCVIFFQPATYFNGEVTLVYYLFLLSLGVIASYNTVLVGKRWYYIKRQTMIGWNK